MVPNVPFPLISTQKFKNGGKKNFPFFDIITGLNQLNNELKKHLFLGVIAKELIAKTMKKEGFNQRIVGLRDYNFLKR